MLSEPAEIGPCAFAQTWHRVYSQRQRWTPSDATRVTPGEDALPPAIALVAPRSLAALAPHPPASMGALRSVICGFHAWDVETYPPRLPGPLSTPSKRPGVVRPSGILVDERAAARLPRPPLPPHGSFCAHMTQPLELGVYPATKASGAGFHTLCQPCGRAEPRRQAALPAACPRLLAPIAIPDQDPPPVAHALRTRRFGTIRVALQVGHCRLRHAPQPLPITMHPPGRLSNRALALRCGSPPPSPPSPLRHPSAGAGATALVRGAGDCAQRPARQAAPLGQKPGHYLG